MIISIILSAIECWKLSVKLEKYIRIFENTCLKRILNILWQEKVTNIRVLQQTTQILVTDLLKCEDGCTLAASFVSQRIDIHIHFMSSTLKGGAKDVFQDKPCNSSVNRIGAKGRCLFNPRGRRLGL